MQVKPTPLLSGIVRHFLVIESDTQPAMRIFSDGNTGVVFNYGRALFYQNKMHSGPSALPASFLYGQLDTYRNVWATGNIRLLIAVLYPFGAAPQPAKRPRCQFDPARSLVFVACRVSTIHVLSVHLLWGKKASYETDQNRNSPV